MTTASEAVRDSGLPESLFDVELAERIAADESAGRGSWGWDPDVDGVVGFRVRSASGSAVVVILWLEAEDFEADDRYDESWNYGAER